MLNAIATPIDTTMFSAIAIRFLIDNIDMACRANVRIPLYMFEASHWSDHHRHLSMSDLASQ